MAIIKSLYIVNRNFKDTLKHIIVSSQYYDVNQYFKLSNFNKLNRFFSDKKNNNYYYEIILMKKNHNKDYEIISIKTTKPVLSDVYMMKEYYLLLRIHYVLMLLSKEEGI